MPEYRLYVFEKTGELVGPVFPIHADDDAAAIVQAAGQVDGLAAEVRDALRLIKRFSDRRPERDGGIGGSSWLKSCSTMRGTGWIGPNKLASLPRNLLTQKQAG